MRAEKTTPPKLNKSEFIRSQPGDLSASAVVENAKANGVAVTTGLVYGVRSQLRANGKTKNGPAYKSSAAKTAPVSPKTSKADFVRKFPNASPKEVVAKAQAEGIQIDLDYVYNVRSTDKVGKTRPGTEPRDSIPRVGASLPRPVATGWSAEDLLKAVAAEVGLGRAFDILVGERARVHALIGA